MCYIWGIMVMREEDLKFKKIIEDLYNRSYNNGVYTYTKFLDMAQGSVARQVTGGINPSLYEYFGGTRDCERVVLRFGSEELVGYQETFPIVILEIRPINAKFADKLSHRDVLGAVLNLGLARDVLGDIYIYDDCIYLMCLDSVSDFIIDELVRIKHTTVAAKVSEIVPDMLGPNLKEMVLIVPSLRIDVLIAKIFHLSRSESETLFAKEKVFINGKMCTKSGIPLKDGDVISARGYGKFIYDHENSTTKKGNLSVVVQVYV